MHGSKQSLYRDEKATGQMGILIENNLDDLTSSIPTKKAAAMEDIAHHAHRPLPRQGIAVSLRLPAGPSQRSRGSSLKPVLGPDKHMVDQAAQQQQPWLSRKALFVAFGQADPCITFKAGFNASSPLVIQPQQSQQPGVRVRRCLRWQPGQVENIAIRKPTDQDPDPPLSI